MKIRNWKIVIGMIVLITNHLMAIEKNPTKTEQNICIPGKNLNLKKAEEVAFNLFRSYLVEKNVKLLPTRNKAVDRLAKYTLENFDPANSHLLSSRLNNSDYYKKIYMKERPNPGGHEFTHDGEIKIENLKFFHGQSCEEKLASHIVYTMFRGGELDMVLLSGVWLVGLSIVTPDPEFTAGYIHFLLLFPVKK